MKQEKRKTRSSVAAPERATETGTTGQLASTSTYNDTITCRSQSIVAKAGLNSRESSYQEHFCAICCSQKVFTPNFSDTHIVELYNKFAELSLLQRHNLFYSRLFFYHRFGDPLFKLLLVGRVAERCSRRESDFLAVCVIKVVLPQKDCRNRVYLTIQDVILP